MSLDADLGVRLDGFELSVPLTVADGETVVLLGPNGAGKTTALRTIAGLRALDRGRVVVDDRLLDEPSTGAWVPTERRPIAVVFQDYLLFPHLNTRDNVVVRAARPWGERAEARAQADEWLTRLGLDGYADAKPARLSGGQAQRVALARALACEPRSAAARRAPRRARRARREVRCDASCASISPTPARPVSSSPTTRSTRSCSRTGSWSSRPDAVVQAGTVDDLQARPRTRYVADLVGVNLYRAVADGSHVRVDHDGELAAVNDDALSGPVLVMIRPQAVALHQRRPEGSPRNVWSVTVRDLDVLGDRARVQLVGGPPITAEVTRHAVADLALAPGTPVWASVKAADVTLFPF